MAPRHDEHVLRSRYIVPGALFVLFVLYFVKVTFPNETSHAAQSTYNYVASAVTDSMKSGSGSEGSTAVHTSPKTISVESAGSLLNVSKVAVVIEPRPEHNFIPLVLHFMSVLGPSWPIVIYTESEMTGQFSSSAALSRHIAAGQIQIRILPQTVMFTDPDSVSAFLTQAWFWASLAPAEWVLMFQSDSILCSKAVRSVEDYFQYDFIGAPRAGALGRGFSGGLSLRKRNSMLRVLKEWTWDPELNLETSKMFEDEWFFDGLTELRQQSLDGDGKPPTEGSDIIRLPSLEVARTFAVESIDYPHPLGVHQPLRWLGSSVVDLNEWCPEWKLCARHYSFEETEIDGDAGK